MPRLIAAGVAAPGELISAKLGLPAEFALEKPEAVLWCADESGLRDQACGYATTLLRTLRHATLKYRGICEFMSLA